MNDYSIGDGFGEVIEAEILPNSPFINKDISQMELPKTIRVGAILRDKKIIIPKSKTIFQEKDDVVFFSETKSVKTFLLFNGTLIFGYFLLSIFSTIFALWISFIIEIH